MRISGLSAVYIADFCQKALRGAKVALGAQDCHFETKGAHTGDISPAMLADLGCSYVILGHSERRADHHESNELVNKKAVAAHAVGLKTVICIGETLEQREAGKAIEVCKEQILGSVPDDSTSSDTVIAYEPVWAIGTGKFPPRLTLRKFTPPFARSWPKNWEKAMPIKCAFFTAVP